MVYFVTAVGQDRAPHCIHCRQKAELVTGEIVYPHRPDLHSLYFWSCKACDAFVGCHKKGAPIGRVKNCIVVSDGKVPLGKPANAELRQRRLMMHNFFDAIWKTGRAKRQPLYRELAKLMGIKTEECHFSHFNMARCTEAGKAISRLRYKYKVDVRPSKAKTEKSSSKNDFLL